MMWGAEPEKVKALMSYLGNEVERIVREKLFSDVVDVAPGLKIIGATVVVAAAVHYARRNGLTRETVVNLADLSCRASDVAEASSNDQPSPKSDDE